MGARREQPQGRPPIPTPPNSNFAVDSERGHNFLGGIHQDVGGGSADWGDVVLSDEGWPVGNLGGIYPYDAPTYALATLGMTGNAVSEFMYYHNIYCASN